MWTIFFLIVITGATDGIGKSYSKSVCMQLTVNPEVTNHFQNFQLAKRGMNIVLVSRSIQKLQAVAKEISDTYCVDTLVIDVDFTSGPEIYEKIKNGIRGKEIGVLVNNVGVSYVCPDFFLSIPNREAFIQNIINVNVTSVPMMCSIILPQMVQRKKGIIINLSSITATIPSSNLTCYSATKAFVNKFSQDLASEYGKDGIIVQSVVAGYISTRMTGVDSSFLIPSSETFVESALKKVSFTNCTTGYYIHSIHQFAHQIANFVWPSLTNYIMLQFWGMKRKQRAQNGRYCPIKTENYIDEN